MEIAHLPALTGRRKQDRDRQSGITDSRRTVRFSSQAAGGTIDPVAMFRYHCVNLPRAAATRNHNFKAGAGRNVQRHPPRPCTFTHGVQRQFELAIVAHAAMTAG